MSISGVSDSQFAMWRTVFALAHADDIVTSEEVRFMAEALEDVPFSEEQKTILNEDVSVEQDVEEMFNQITDVKDQAAFFKFAHAIVHVDGDYGEEEQAVMLRLKELHTQSANVDDLIGNVSLEFEAEPEEAAQNVKSSSPKSFKALVRSFVGKD